MLDVKTAMAEVTKKSPEQIEVETAHKWASRAAACFLLYEKNQDVRRLLQAKHYYDEALEHAALADDGGTALRMVQQLLSKYVPPGL